MNTIEQKVKAEFAVFFSRVNEGLPNTPEMAAVGSKRIMKAVYPAFLEMRAYIYNQGKMDALGEVEEWIIGTCNSNDSGGVFYEVYEEKLKAHIASLKEKL